MDRLRGRRIRKITPDGVVSMLAGSPQQSGGITDGLGAQARFVTPLGIALDAAGNFFVADCSSGSVRKISPAGAVTQPKLEVFDASGNSLATNAGWGGALAVSADFNLAGAFPLEPASTDAVVLLELSPATTRSRPPQPTA